MEEMGRQGKRGTWQQLRWQGRHGLGLAGQQWVPGGDSELYELNFKPTLIEFAGVDQQRDQLLRYDEYQD